MMKKILECVELFFYEKAEKGCKLLVSSAYYIQ